MKQLNRFQNLLFQVGGLLLVAGAIMPMIPAVNTHAATVFTIGALLFGSMQLLQRYDGPNVVIRRLRRQQILGAFFLMFAAALLVMKQYHVGPIPIRGDEWKIALIVAAVLELYTAFRIPSELEKENK
ncbi:MAG: hypothetical protein Q4D23_01090 [Bacteroidales bacterium]|nr:hypothetical protein [Bacteroidales bacterium]